MILEDETLKKLRVCLNRYQEMPKCKQRGVMLSPFTLIRVRLGTGEFEYRGDDAVHPVRPFAVPPDNPGTYRIGSSSGVFGVSERHAAEPSEKIYRVHVDPRFFAEFEEDVSLLYLACREKNEKVIAWLIREGIEIDNDETDEGVTPLYLAIGTDDIYIVKWMIQSGVNVNKPNTRDGETPLHIAVSDAIISQYDSEMVKLLIDAGADVNHVDKMSSNTPLLTALINQDEYVARFLISRRADVDKGDGTKDCTPLMIAAEHGLAKMVALFLNMGSDPNYMGREGHTALFAAIGTGDDFIVGLLFHCWFAH
jgi:hypothetical protein